MSTFIGMGANKIVDENQILLDTLNDKISTLENQLNELTEANAKLSEERDNLVETNKQLNTKIVELTEAVDKKTKKD